MDKENKIQGISRWAVPVCALVILLLGFFIGEAASKTQAQKKADSLKVEISAKEKQLSEIKGSVDVNSAVLASLQDQIKTNQDKLQETKTAVENKNSVHIKGEVKQSVERGMTKLDGEIENGTDSSTNYWKVTATFYDKDGNVLGSNIDNSTDELKSGATAPFEITTYPDKYIADSYKLDVAQ